MAIRSVSASGSNGGKKLTIKVKSKPTLPVSYLEETWNSLSKALEAVRSRRPAEHGHEELYSMVENLCLHRLGGEVYVRLYQNVDSYVLNQLNTLWQTSSLSSPFLFAQHFSETWQHHTEQMKAIRLIFTVLDRSLKSLTQTTTTQVPNAKSLWDMGLQIFRKHLEKNGSCLEKLITDLLEIIRQERLGSQVETENNYHHDLLRMLSNLNLYSSHFESRFLSTSQEFYSSESIEKMNNLNVPDYLLHCEKRFDEESKRSIEYLDSSSRKSLRKIVEQCLIVNHSLSICEKGLDTLLDDDARLSDLARLYKMFISVNEQQIILKGFSVYTKAKGMAYVMDDENQDLVGTLLQFKAKIDRILKTAFDSDEIFVKSSRDSFESFLNSRDNKPAELIAKYTDRALRSHSMDTETILQKTMELFRFLHAKDVFEEFYKRALAKRLLLGISSSDDLEKMMISILKAECGGGFTNKLEMMFRDIEMGKTIANDWNRFRASSSSSSSLEGDSLDMSVRVLSAGFWPTFPDTTVQLPLYMANEQEKFKQFYFKKHQGGRTLQFLNSLGHCMVRAFLPKGKWDLEVSLPQAIVLLQFNNGVKSLTFQQIAEGTKIQTEELIRTMTSLALGKREQRVLIRTFKGSMPPSGNLTTSQNQKSSENSDESDGEDGEEQQNNNNSEATKISKEPHLDDIYQVNVQWSSKRSRLKINQIQVKETKKENDDSHKKVAHDRQYQIDATIVRVMKARKQLSHTLLVTELFKQLPFPTKPQDLKKRIENLIEREYVNKYYFY